MYKISQLKKPIAVTKMNGLSSQDLVDTGLLKYSLFHYKLNINSSCVFNPCHGKSSVFYNGKCQDLFEDGACGDDLGKRLYLGEDGEAYCDCMEGWLSIDGKCYQEFTPVPEFCNGENEILRLKKPNTKWVSPDEKILAMKLKYTFSCEENVCEQGFLPHR